MPRITTVTMESASQEQRQFLTQAQRAKGGVLPCLFLNSSARCSSRWSMASSAASLDWACIVRPCAD